MSTVLFKRGDMATMNATPITDGMVFFNEENDRIYMDNGNTRYQYGGDTELISNVNIATINNAFNANASLNLFTQKTTVVDDKDTALNVTQDYIPLGCKAFKEAVGISDYSGVADGTISGGLVKLNNQLTANNNSIYMDYQNGKYGINTSANRGADTFIPFKQEPEYITVQRTVTITGIPSGSSKSGYAYPPTGYKVVGIVGYSAPYQASAVGMGVSDSAAVVTISSGREEESVTVSIKCAPIE